MALTPAFRRASALVAAFVVATAWLGVGVRGALAATPSVSAPTATATFLSGISFRGDATMTIDVVRVELVLDVEGSTRAEVADVAKNVRSGPTTLSYLLQTPSGDLLPNTDVTARFRLTLADGSSISGPPTTIHYDDTRYSWKIFSGQFVRVHYTDGGTTFGRRAATIGDDAIRKVSALLGVTETDPIDFYVYADRTAFYDVLGPGTRENVGGEARPDIRTLFANIEPAAVNDSWVGVVIPHELTHLVLDTAVRNPYHYPPRWLNEGIAVYLSEGYGASDRSAVADAVRASSVMPLEALTAQFPTTQERFFLAYSESVSAVSFLVDHYGRDAMVALVRSYKDGVSDDEAFQAALKTDVAGFAAAWLAAIGSPSPSPFGPQPAPAGPLPSGWGGAAPTPGTAPEASTTPAASATTNGPTSDSSAGGAGSTVSGVLLLGALAVIVIGIRRRRAIVVRRNAQIAGGILIDAPPPVAAPAPMGDAAGPTSYDGGPVSDIPVTTDVPAGQPEGSGPQDPLS